MPLSDVVGHAPLVALLRQVVARDAVPQTLLFAGPDGVGKHTAARALAQAVNCPNRGRAGHPADDACGACPTCVRIAKGRHFDVVEQDTGGAASIGIEPLRLRVLDAVGYRPFEARRRVFVIDPADALTSQAQDALLKTLEEPPPGSMLILVTAAPDALHSTVQSRCRRLRFAPLSEADVQRVLVERADVEGRRAAALAALSGGSVSRALAEAGGELDDDRAAALALVGAAARRDVPPRLKAAAALAQHGSKRRDRAAMAARLEWIASFLRDLAALAVGDRAAIANADLEADLARVAPAFDRARLVGAWAAVTRAQHALDRNASPKIVADWLAVSM